MEFVVTDADRQFAEYLVEKFNPEKALDKPFPISEEDWAVYMEPHRVELRNEITAAQVVAALHAAGLLETINQTAVGDTLELLGLDRYEMRDRKEWLSVMDRIKHYLPNTDDPVTDNVHHAVQAAIRGVA